MKTTEKCKLNGSLIEASNMELGPSNCNTELFYQNSIAIQSCKRVTEVEESPNSTLSFKISMQHKLSSSHIYASQIIMTFFCLTPTSCIRELIFLHLTKAIQCERDWRIFYKAETDFIIELSGFEVNYWKHRLHKIKVPMHTDAQS